MSFDVEALKQQVKALGQAGLNIAQSGVDKGIQLAAAAKLHAANVKEESNLRAAYQELGKMYFADHGAEPEEAYAAVCATIAEIQAAIASNNAKIAESKVAPETEAEVEAKPEEEAAPAEEPAAEEPAPAEEAPVEEAPAEEAAPAGAQEPEEEPEADPEAQG